MTPSRDELVALVLDPDHAAAARVDALSQLESKHPTAVLNVAMAIAERTGEAHDVAYAAGSAIARAHFRRGSVSDAWLADFSDAAFHGFDDTLAAIEKRTPTP